MQAAEMVHSRSKLIYVTQLEGERDVRNSPWELHHRDYVYRGDTVRPKIEAR